MRRHTVDAILVRHFLRRFLENDLIAPDADRLQLLAVLGAGLISSTLFISAFMSFPYVGVPWTPGQLALQAMHDRVFYVALSMVVTALVAVAQWDALVVDARDAAILEPLPIRPSAVRRAKIAAVALLGGAVALALNAVPSLVFPWLLVYHTSLRVVDMLAINATHLAVTVAAGGGAYLAVIGLRETLATLLPARVFVRVSPWVQGTLIVALGTALLMVPPAASQAGRRGFEGAQAMNPAAWFVGAYEVAVGGLIADGPRGRLTPRQQQADAVTTAAYRRHRAAFPRLARRAALALGGVLLVVALPYAWNARRYTALAPQAASASRRRWRLGTRLATTWLVRDATARAGFFFALSAMWRSGVHRLTLAGAAAAGVAMSAIALSGVDLPAAAREGIAPSRLLLIQPLLYGTLLVGFRHAIRVPAELRANWGFQLAWREHERQFIAGTRRAAVLSLVLPVLLLVAGGVAAVLGPRLALLHAALGLAGALLVLEVLLINYAKVPFTCTYLPSESMKALAPLYLVVFLAGASSFAGLQAAALRDTGAAIQVAVLLAALFAAARHLSRRVTPHAPTDFDEAPATFQRLGLHT